MAEDEERIAKPNRTARQEPKKHSMLVYKPKGMPKYARPPLSRRQKDKRMADAVKRVAR